MAVLHVRVLAPSDNMQECVMTMFAPTGAHVPGEQTSVSRAAREEPDTGRGHRGSDCWRGEAKGDAQSLAAKP